jgi:hypothetical protein
MSFLDLINKNQIYRSFEPVLWDPVDHTWKYPHEFGQTRRSLLDPRVIYNQLNNKPHTETYLKINATSKIKSTRCLWVFIG